MLNEYDRERIDVLLSAAKESQRLYWDALSELERELDCEIDGEVLSGHDVDSMIALATREDSEPAAD